MYVQNEGGVSKAIWTMLKKTALLVFEGMKKTNWTTEIYFQTGGVVLKCLLQGNPATEDFHRTKTKAGKTFSILMVFLIMSFLDISFCALDYVEVGTNTHTSRWHTCQTPFWYGVDLVYFTPFRSQYPFPFYALLSQKNSTSWKKNSTDMSAASAAFCISATNLFITRQPTENPKVTQTSPCKCELRWQFV